MEQLAEALLDAFRKYQDLELMVKHELGISLSEEISPNTKPLKYIVSDLIDYFEARGKLLKLIYKAHKHNSGNLNLKKIKNIYFPLDLPEKFTLSPDKINELIQILKKIKNLDLLRNICRLTINKFTKAREQIVTCNDVISLLEILLNRYPKQKEDDPLAILEFAQRLYDCDEQDISDQLNYQIKQWLKEATEGTKFSFPINYSKTVDNKPSVSYLAIVVQEAGEPETLEISSFFFKKNNGNFEENKIKSYFCHETNLTKKIGQIINQAEIEIDYFNQKSVVELFLSYKQITQNQCIDLEKIKLQYNRKVTIGYQYCFAIRIIERYTNDFGRTKSTNLENLKNRWLELSNYIKQYNSAARSLKEKSDFFDKVEKKGISKKDKEYNWEKSLLDWNRREVLLLSLTDNLLSKNESNVLFEYMLISGIPIFIWNKKSSFYYESQIFELEVKEIINHGSLSNIPSFHQRIKYYRENSFVEDNPEKYIGYHLGFLLDYPDRIPSCINDHILVSSGQ